MIEYKYNARGIFPRAERALLYPITSGVRAFCSNTSLEGLFGVTVQADSQDRETALLGDFDLAGREGLLVVRPPLRFFTADIPPLLTYTLPQPTFHTHWQPIVKGDLPTYTQRGEVPVFLSGLFAEFGRIVLVPAYAPFDPQAREPIRESRVAPRLAPQPPLLLPSLPPSSLPFTHHAAYGALWTVDFAVAGRPQQVLSPLDYYLAGASGTPRRGPPPAAKA